MRLRTLVTYLLLMFLPPIGATPIEGRRCVEPVDVEQGPPEPDPDGPDGQGPPEDDPDGAPDEEEPDEPMPRGPPERDPDEPDSSTAEAEGPERSSLESGVVREVGIEEAGAAVVDTVLTTTEVPREPVGEG